MERYDLGLMLKELVISNARHYENLMMVAGAVGGLVGIIAQHPNLIFCGGMLVQEGVNILEYDNDDVRLYKKPGKTL